MSKIKRITPDETIKSCVVNVTIDDVRNELSEWFLDADVFWEEVWEQITSDNLAAWMSAEVSNLVNFYVEEIYHRKGLAKTRKKAK